jgi:CheY-like chemotaxis protein
MKKILLVDDDQDFTFNLATMLKADKFEVVIANSKAEGLEKLETENPDLILLDVQMETENAGFEMNKQVRSNPKFIKTPILMLTGIDTFSVSNQVVDMYRQMRNNGEFEAETVLKIKSPDGKVAVDFSSEGNRSYYLPLDGFISKPPKYDHLLDEINKLLSK